MRKNNSKTAPSVRGGYLVSAFTLAEMLVSVVIIATILVLLAHVLTKRIKEEANIAAAANSRLFLYDKNDSDCVEVAGSNTLECSFTIPNGVTKISAAMVSGGGGGAGAAAVSLSQGLSVTATNTTSVSSQTEEIEIKNGMKNVVVTELTGSGGGGGGGAWTMEAGGPQSQSECDPFNAVFVPAKYNGGKTNVCVSKRNAGDSGGPDIPSGVKVVQAGGSSCSASGSGKCCWTKNTSQEGHCADGYGNSYSGCGRTVCNWNAANDICSRWDVAGSYGWRLPTEEELAGWAANLDYVNSYKRDTGINLCDGSDSTSMFVAAVCGNSQVCYGSGVENCHPFSVWSSTFSHSYGWFFDNMKVYVRYSLHSSKFNSSPEATSGTGSVRCVWDGGSSSSSSNHTSITGGGGSAGAYIKNYPIPDDVITSNVGGKIVLYGAAGGAGGASSSTESSDGNAGNDGNTSYVEVYDSNNILKWGIRAQGGNGGKGATSDTAGAGGEKKSVNSCQIYENNTWTTISCTGVGNEGVSGELGAYGGGSMYNSTTALGGGAGGSTSDEDGYSGTNCGAGGGGATVGFDASNNTLLGQGGAGANGAAVVTYDLSSHAAAGGGGGGGAFANVKDISVTPGTVYTITVGGGGFGGAVSSGGTDGGSSGVNFGASIYSLSGGKGGGAGVSQSDTNSLVQGAGGAGGSGNAAAQATAGYTPGESGKDGYKYTKDDMSANGSGYGGSFGGSGGNSGIGTKGGCGGLFMDGSQCSNAIVNGLSNAFAAPSVSASDVDYGQAGAGGGGGGWSEDSVTKPTPGLGAQGQNGYVFIYWRE